jgi:hypothetical protein
MPNPEPKLMVAALLIALAPALGAQSETTTSPQNLAGLKAEFDKDMRREISPAGIQYVEELRKLERMFALAGKFEAAIAARDERAAVQAFLERASGGTAGTSVTTAPPDGEGDQVAEPEPSEPGSQRFADTAAGVSGGAEFTDDGLSLGAEDATASWELDTLEPGGYEVVVTYSAAAATSVQVKESFFRLSGELTPTGGQRKTVSLGTLKITSRSDTVSLTNTGEGSDAKLIVHSIQLISAKD